MTTLTKLSMFNSRIDQLLQGIVDSEISSADRDSAVRQAVTEYNRDYPKHETMEFGGNNSAYYLLWGYAVDALKRSQDTGIALKSAGADARLGVKFSLDYAMELHQVNLILSRVGAVVAGTLAVSIYTVSAGLPAVAVMTSGSIEIDDAEGAPLGRMGKVQFAFAPAELPAGDYYAVLVPNGYTYQAGSSEVSVAVDQTGITANVATYDGNAWSVYAPPSAGLMDVKASLPGWRNEGGSILSVEYPAADIAANEAPNPLEDDDFALFRANGGVYLRFIVHRPAVNEKVRLEYTRPYLWIEAANPVIDIPEMHFEAVCNLAAAIACDWLAARYGQNRESSIGADSVERRSQADQYITISKRFRAQYGALVGQGLKSSTAGMAIVDADFPPSVGSDFLFHNRERR